MYHRYGVIGGRIFDRYGNKYLKINGYITELKVKCKELNSGTKQSRRRVVIDLLKSKGKK